MKTPFFLSVVIGMLLFASSPVQAIDQKSCLEELKQEIRYILKNRDLHFLTSDTQQVTVEFVINARNELVIFDVSGSNESTCEYVKKVLNYKKVKYHQEKQLTPYAFNIVLIKNEES